MQTGMSILTGLLIYFAITEAPVHIITGSAGCREGRDHFKHSPKSWSAFRSQDFGYTRFKAFNKTHLNFEQVSIDLDGKVIDAFWMVKNKKNEFNRLVFTRILYESDPPAHDCEYCQPEQIHISYGEKLNDIVVTWSTFENTEESLVRFGERVFSTEAAGNSSTLSSGERIQYIHRVALRGLKFDTRYVYTCGSKYAWSELFTFKTPSEGNGRFDAIIFGDLGMSNAHALPYLQTEAETKSYDVILHVGDIAYEMYVNEGRVGDQFMRQIQPLAALVPYMTVPGNHEEYSNFTQYKSRFTMPYYETQDSMYYSWDIGSVHWVGINTEAFYFLEYGVDTLVRMYKWLVNDLEEANKPANRSVRPWVMLYGHRPMYCSNSDDVSNCTHERTRYGVDECGDQLNLCRIEPLLQKFGVDVVIWAHEHSFERTWPLYDGKVYNGSEQPYVNPGAPIHVITGSAGCLGGQDPFIDDPAPWSVFRSTDFGYTRFSAHNHTHIYFEQVSVDMKGVVIDSFWVVKDHHGPYNISKSV